MSGRPPEPDRKAFLRALDGSQAFRAILQVHQADALSLMASFRARIGDNCTYVWHAIRKIWYDEMERDEHGFREHLRSAGYPL